MPAIVVDEKEAKNTPCSCYKTDGDELCTTKGASGFLTDEQEEKYCSEKTFKGKRAYGVYGTELPSIWEKVSLTSVIQDVCWEENVSRSELGACVSKAGDLISKGLPRSEIEEKLAGEYGVEVD